MRIPLVAVLSLFVALALPAFPAQAALHRRQCRGKSGARVSGHNDTANSGIGDRWSHIRNKQAGRVTPSVEEDDGAIVEVQAQASPVRSPAPQNDAAGDNSTRTSIRTVLITDRPKSSAQPISSAAPEPTTMQATSGGGGVSDTGRKGKISTQDPKQLLKLHNDYRAARGKPALVWDDTQAAYGAKYALDCDLEHSGGKYGENLSSGSGGHADELFAIWTNEEKDYDPNSMSALVAVLTPDPQYSHYTQVVWRSATKLGCAMIDCPPGSLFEPRYGTSTYLICEYDTGNVSGQYADNV